VQPQKSNRYKMKVNKLGLAGVIALSGLIAFASGTFAQTNAPAPGGGGRGGGRGGAAVPPEVMLAQMTTNLTLTADQQTKIKPILDDMAKTTAAIPQDDADRRGKMTSARDSATTKISAILTPEQKTKFDASGGLRGGGRGGRGGGRGAGGPPPGQ
jgi:Spy/CpxP family protein refolding chaperone